jgi:PKHD-type hydroxylase
MWFAVSNVLEQELIGRASGLIKLAKFVDGRATGSADKRVKNNLEMEVSEPYLKLVEMLDRSVDSSHELRSRLLPRSRTTPVINRYDVGMAFAEHVDAPIQGGQTQFGRAPGRFGQNFLRTDFSMTLFLTDPQHYDGGELELREDEQAQLVKLPAGSAVCYQTGTRHSVRPITRGSRVCAVYWFQSLVPDARLLRAIWDLDCVAQRLRNSGDGSELQTIHANLVRCLAQV